MKERFGLNEFHEEDGVHWSVALDRSSNPEPEHSIECRTKEDAIRLDDFLVSRLLGEKKIVLTVEGGVVQNIDGIPEGVVVEVHDYDTDSEAEGGLVEGPEIKKDAEGNSYALGVWGHVAEKETIKKRYCCFIPCDKDAEFEIQNVSKGADPYDFTDSCEDHVGKMLGSDDQKSEPTDWHVHIIPEEE